ncbi:hypothetical protein TI03_06090 [Achromatium sp. WMS1]|nr:hypothetical protein TI03_06090 [Achromatium sp. WMS1]
MSELMDPSLLTTLPSYPPDPPPHQNTLRIPPYSIPAEQSLLGALLLDNSVWNQIADQVDMMAAW